MLLHPASSALTAFREGEMARLCTVAVLAALVGGCGGEAARSGSASLEEGSAAYRAGQYQAAADQFTDYLQAGPASPHQAEAYYYRGLAHVQLKERREALEDFQRAVQSRPPPDIESLASVAMGNLYFEDGADAPAADAYIRGLRQPPPELPQDRVLLRLAISLQRMGRWGDADTYLARLIERYPSTAAATEARRRYRAGGFAVQTGAYASGASALREAQRLRQAGFHARLAPIVRNSQALHAVQVGQVQTYAEAQALARRVNAAGFTAMVVP
jgi:tetratricopeptide (TPR) repeat protein